MSAMNTATGTEIRWLTQEQTIALDPIIRAHGWVPLNPELSRVLAAFDGEQMVGFIALNCIPHIEPLYVSTSHRGTGIAEELVSRMVAFLYEVDCPAAYVIADNPVSEKLAKAHGMERVDVPVYRKVR